MIFNVSGGGGSGGLNFRVVGGTTAPASPKENTIWVNTDVDITSWAFDAEEPGPAETGMVWFVTGTSSRVAFNALKKNAIQIYPLVAKQYVSGQWAGVDVEVFQNDAWVVLPAFDGYLFNYGSVNEEVTGGWVTKNVPHAAGHGGYPTVASQSDGSVLIYTGTEKSGIYVTKNKIDLSNYSTITFTGYTYDNNGYGRAGLKVWSDIGRLQTDNVVASFYKNSATVATHTIDVSSLIGSYYIGFTVVLDDGKVRLCSLKLS